MLDPKTQWRRVICLVSVPLMVTAAGCSSIERAVSGQSSSSSTQAPTSHQAAPGSAGVDRPTTQSATPASETAAPGKVTSGILAVTFVGNKWTYAFIDPNSGQYSEAVTFTVPSTPGTHGTSFRTLAASPDLTKFAVTTMSNGQSAAGWIDASGQFTSVTQAATTGAFGGNPPSYDAIGFDGAGNYYYKENSQGARYTEVYKVPAGSTSNAQEVTMTPPGAIDQGGAALNSDGGLLFGCSNMTGNWLNANTMVMAIAPGTQIAKIAVAGTEKGGCPKVPASSEVTLLPTTNTAMVHDPVANAGGTKVAFFYDDPDRVKHNYLSLYTVGTDGNSQPTLVNLAESDAKKLTGATLLRWS